MGTYLREPKAPQMVEGSRTEGWVVNPPDQLQEILTFAGDHPIITILIVWSIAKVIIVGIIRTYRVIMVSARGWPPVHLDADGDWKPEPDKDTP